jgi:putative transposase
MIFVLGVWAFVRALLGNSASVSLENVALRHQLAMLQRSVGRPRLRRRDRLFWVGLSRLWAGWRASLLIVQPATVLAWHRQGFQLYWRWKSRCRSAGRPPLDLELRTLIRRMARENPTWGRRRIQAELRFLGYEVAELTVAKYMQRPSPRPSSTWRIFLEAHIRDIVAVDFFVVPTLTFRCSSDSWSFDTTVENSSMSTSPTTQPPPGLPTSWSRASQKRRRLSTCSAIEMPSTAACSYGE